MEGYDMFMDWKIQTGKHINSPQNNLLELLGLF